MICAFVLLSFLVVSTVIGDELCSETGTCTAKYERPLRWRPFPYYVSHPDFARRVYGGDFVRRAFGKHFEGPEENEDWDLLWTHRSQCSVLNKMKLPARVGRRLVNHCDYFRSAGDKCEFARLTNHIRPNSVRQHLRSFDLGEDLDAWTEIVLAQPDKYWVLKPCLGGASRGIQIHRGMEALSIHPSLGSHVVAQEYLEPFLGYDGHKFHLRLYVLVTRWAPIGVYLFDEGVVFWSKEAHDPSNLNTENNIFSGISDKIDALPLASLWLYLDSLPSSPAAEDPGTTSKIVRQRILDVLAELMSDSENGYLDLESSRGFSCFDLFGADVMLDKQLQPHVLEFNVGPNLWIDNHGPEYKKLLGPIKAPLIEQLVSWATLAVRSRNSSNEEEAKMIETTSLKNFTRVL